MQASTAPPSSKIDIPSSKWYSPTMQCSLIVNRLSKLVETISKKPIPQHQNNVIFEMTVEDQTEEDVEVPYAMVKLRK